MLFLGDAQWNWTVDDYDEKDLICGVYELETGMLSSLFDFELPNHPFKVTVIKWNACHGGHGNLSSFTQACGLGIGPLIARLGSNIV